MRPHLRLSGSSSLYNASHSAAWDDRGTVANRFAP